MERDTSAEVRALAERLGKTKEAAAPGAGAAGGLGAALIALGATVESGAGVVRRLTDPLSIHDLLTRYPNRRGSAAVRAVLPEARLAALLRALPAQRAGRRGVCAARHADDGRPVPEHRGSRGDRWRSRPSSSVPSNS